MMLIQKITPTDRAAWLALRGQDVTASQIGALFGVHDFTTLFEVWALKTGRLPRSEEETPAMQRGRLLEPVAVQLLREQFPQWKITHNAAANVYYREPASRLGGTPDVIAHRPGAGRAKEPGVVQIKSVDASVFRRKWLDADGNVEPPLWIALQATLEAHLTGGVWAAVAPLVIGYGLEMPLVEIPLVPGVIDAMRSKAAEFWRMVEEGREPPADYSRDARTIDAIFPGDDDEEIDLTSDNRIPDLISERAAHLAAIREAEAGLSAIEAEVKAKMGDATVAHLASGRRITRPLIKRAGHFVQPSTYRQLRFPKQE